MWDRDVIGGVVSFCMFLEGASDRVIENQLTFYRSRVRGVLMCNCYIEGWMMSLYTHVSIISAGVDTMQFLHQYVFINC